MEVSVMKKATAPKEIIVYFGGRPVVAKIRPQKQQDLPEEEK